MAVIAPFIAPPNPPTCNPWLFAGLASSFPNLEPSSSTKLSEVLHCPSTTVSDASPSSYEVPASKILQLSAASSTTLIPSEALSTVDLKEQVLIFQYRGRFHAINHLCPHSSYPLSRGKLHDIEDFGIVLSAGITCPKHGWTFDLFTGESDRGPYQLRLWEVEIREKTGAAGTSEGREVWVRRKLKQRQG